MPGEKLVYVNSPRCGCTTIKHILLDILGIDKSNIEKYGNIHDLFFSEHFFEFTLNRNLSVAPENYIYFSVVRNPYDRVVSFYEGKRGGVVAKNGYRLTKDVSFTDFIYRLEDMGPSNFEEHLCPQYQGFRIPEMDYVVRFEFFKSDVKELFKSLGYEVEVPWKNKSDRSDYRSYYNEDTKKIIKTIYREDFDKLDYSW